MFDIFDSATTQTIAGLAQAGVTPAVAILAVLTSLAGLVAALPFARRLATDTHTLACPLENGAGPSPSARRPAETAHGVATPMAPMKAPAAAIFTPATPLTTPSEPVESPATALPKAA